MKNLLKRGKRFYSKVIVEQDIGNQDIIQQQKNERIKKLLDIPEIVNLDKKSFLSGNLFICPTPLGNLQDLSIKSYHVLQEADIIICEDSRITGKLFKLLRTKDFETKLENIKEQDMNDEYIFNKFQQKREVDHQNMLEIRRERQKVKELFYENDIQKTKDLAKKKLQDNNTLSFLNKYKEEKGNFYGDDYNYDGKEDFKNRLGIDSEYVNYLKKQIYKSKLENKRGLLVSSNRYTEEGKSKEIIRMIRAGFKIALVTDAGSPCISDPGSVLINECIKKNIMIHSIPGPSAITIALTSSGFPADQYQFIGYLSKIESKREEQIEGLKTDKTSVYFENKNRVLKNLINLEKVLGQDHMIYIAIEMTKLHERHLRGRLSKIIEKLNKNPDYTIPSLKGELCIVVSPFKEQKQIKKQDNNYNINIKETINILQDNIDIPPKDLAKIISLITKEKSNKIYKTIINKQLNQFNVFLQFSIILNNKFDISCILFYYSSGLS